MRQILEGVARQCGEPQWVPGDPMTSDQSYESLFDGAAPLRGNEDPDEGVLVWSCTSALTPLVCTLVRLHGPATALGFVKTENLDRLHKRAGLLRTLLQFKQFLTTDELAVRAEAFVRFLEQNRASLLATGYPDARFTTWPAPLAVNLYPVRFPQNLFDDALAPQPQHGTGELFVAPRAPLQWCCPTTTDDEHQPALSRKLQAVPCRYDEAPLIDVRDAEDVERLEAGRSALLELKMRLMERLARALQRGSAVSLWDDCLRLLTDALKASEADFYLTVDHRRGPELRQTGHLGRANWAELLPGGLTEVFEVIGYVEKELTIGTMDRTKRELGRVVDPDEDHPYLSAIGTAGREQIDAALDGFQERTQKEATYWQEYQARVNAALQNEFCEEVVARTRVKRPYAVQFEARLGLQVEWYRDQLEQTGSLPALQLSQLKPVSANRFRRVGNAWDLAFDGLEIPFPDTKGMCHIQYLLQRPGVPVHVLDLVRAAEGTITATDTPDREATAAVLAEIGASGVGFGDAGPLIEREDIKQLWQQKKEIDTEIIDAEEFGNSVRAEELKGQKDWIVKYLAGAVGRDGKPRVAGRAEEKARSTVTQAITRTCKKIGEVHPSLRDHLAAISTGTYCCYDPSGDTPPIWEI
jgi:hypothetical protein